MGDDRNNKKILQNIKMPEQSNDYRVVSNKFAIFPVKSAISGPEFDLIPVLNLAGGVRRWRCREKFAGSPVHQGDIPGKLHPDHRGHLQTGMHV